MLRWLHIFPTFSPKFEGSYPCTDGSGYSKFLNSGKHAASFLVPGGFSSLFIGFHHSTPVSWRLEEPSLVDSLETSRLQILNHRASSFLVPRRPLFFHRRSLGWLEIPNLTRKFPPYTGNASPDSQVLLFAVGEPSFDVVSCLRFDMAPITMRYLTCKRKLLKWLQEHIEELFVLNWPRRWFNSSRKKLLEVRLSAICFLVSTCLIWILGSKLILSNN